MPNLGDFLGHILAETTIARMHADLEALRVADLYASHPLLRHMPVPRFRLSDFEIDLPVVIDQMDEAKDDKLYLRGGIIKEQIDGAFTRALSAQLLKHDIRVPSDLLKNIGDIVKQRIESLTAVKEIAVDASRVASDLTKSVTQLILKSGGDFDRERLRLFSDELRNAARLEILAERTPVPRLQVLVTTREIKEAGSPEINGRLKLQIYEDCVEWALIERDDETLERLVPE
ncbi:MAG: hypothetical protein FOGNACKC_00723 [Anaerolineae bacterium]|nr:hypothetical protein [Anaerolineae bacterium]